MKRMIMSVAACAMLLVTSCTDEELVQQERGENFTIQVSMGVESRTMNDETGVCLWEERNEQIFVISEDGKVYGTLSCLSVAGDKKAATFSGIVNGDPSTLKYVVYPVPTDIEDLTIPTGNVNGKNHRAPMFGEIVGGGAQFQYAGGLIKLVLEGATSAKIGAKVNNANTNVMTGTYRFDLESSKMKFYPNETVSSIELNNIGTDGVVYVPVATEVTIESGSTETTTLVSKIDMELYVGNSNSPIQMDDVTVETMKIATNDVPNVEVKGNEVVVGIVVKTPEELKDALSNQENEGKNVKLGANLGTGNNPLTQGFEVSIQNVTLDLNGKSIEVWGDDVFDVSGSLIIDGPRASVVKTGGLNQSGEGVCVVWAHGGSVTINGGYYQADIDENENRSDCIYAGYNGDNTETIGHITINNGYFEFLGNYTLDDGESGYDVGKDGDTFLLNCANSDANKCQIVVNGGFFKNHVPTLENYGTTNEVILGENKNVYLPGNENPVNVKHSGADVIWYEVK